MSKKKPKDVSKPDERAQAKRRPARARFGGETVEPRILLSATWITGTGGDDYLNGTKNDDCIDGLGGNDTLNGNNGDDVLRGGLGDDTLNGNGGTDTADYSQAGGAVQVNLLMGKATGADGNDRLSGIEIVVGSNYDDTLTGNFTNETLLGGAGNDKVYTSLGNDVFDGGAGIDTLSFENSLLGAKVDLTISGPQDTLAAGRDTITGFERAIGTWLNDTFSFTNAHEGDSYFVDGGSGTDTLDVTKYHSSNAVMTGNSVTIDLGGGHTFRVDFDHMEKLAFIDVTLNPGALPNNAPTVDAGTDQNVAEGATVTLSGTGSDADGDALSYQWVQTGGPGVNLAGDTTSHPTFVAPEGVANYDLEFALKVSDGTDTTIDTVTIHVGADNDLATADAGVDQSVAEHDVVHLDGSASTDPEGQALTYTWVQTGGPAVTLDDAHAAQPTFTAPEALADTDLNFQLQVSDGVNTSVADTVTIHVHAVDDAPAADAGVDQSVGEHDVVTLDGSASNDPEGQALTYTWVQTSGTRVTLDDAHAAQPTFTAPEGLRDGDVQFELRVSDGVNTSVADTVTIHVTADDDAPTADAGGDQRVNEGDRVRLDARGSTDPEGQALTYTWVQTGGPAVALSGATTARPTFAAPELATDTDLKFEVQVSDGVNTTVDSVTVHVAANDGAPTLAVDGAEKASAGDLVKLGATATDPENQSITLTWRQVGGPAVTLSDTHSDSPTFTAPEVRTRTTLTFEVAASDGTNTTVDTVTVTVDPDQAPEVQVPGVVAAIGGEIVAVTAAAKDAEHDALTYTWRQTGGTPVALSSANQPQLTFVAPEVLRATDLTFEIAVSDGHTVTVQTVTVIVSPLPVESEVPPVTTTTTTTNEPAPVTTTNNDTTAIGTRPTSTAPTATETHTTTTTTTQTTDGTSTQTPPVTSTTTDTGGATSTVGDGTNATTARVDAGADQSTTEGALVRLGAVAADVGSAVRYSWTQLAGPPVALEGGQTASASFTAPDAASDYLLVFRVTASDGSTTAADTVTIDVTAADGASPIVQLAPVGGDAGSEIRLAPSVGANTGGEATYVWRQVEGTPVAIGDAEARELNIRLPESFVEEELVFEVVIVSGGRHIVQEVTVHVQPVTSLARDAIDVGDPEAGAHHADDLTVDQPSRGVGKLWAALFAFVGMRQNRR